MPFTGEIAAVSEILQKERRFMLYYILKFIISVIVILPFYLIIRKPWKRQHKREAALAVFVLFMCGLLILTLEGDYQRPSVMIARAWNRIRTKGNINLRPFSTIIPYFKYFEFDNFMTNIVGNIVMFMPWGFGLSLFWKKNRSVYKIIVYSLMLTLFIETAQLFIGRKTDIDDIMLNFLGSCLGALLFYVVKKRTRRLDIYEA